MVIGMLLGYVITAALTTVVSDAGLLGSAGEPSNSRQYMLKLLSGESESLSQMRPQRDVVTRALEQQSAQQAQQNRAQPKAVSLTYLGGQSSGRFSVQIYAVELQGQNGKAQFFPLALTLVSGKVVRTE